MRCGILWNAHAGSVAQHEAIRTRCRQEPALLLITTESAEDAKAGVGRLIEQGVRRLIAAGGDGTVHLVANEILRLQAEVEFGVLPLGTGNDTARSLGLPLDPDEALSVLLDSPAQPMDVFHVRSETQSWFAVNMVTVGNTGKYTESLTEEIKQRWGAFSYLRGVVAILQDLEVFDLCITCEGSPAESFQALNVFAANGRMSGGGLTVSPDAYLNDGVIDLIVIKDGAALEVAQLTGNFLMDDYLQHDLIEFRQASAVMIQAAAEMPATVDGDPFRATRLSISVCRNALQVVAGAEASTFLSQGSEQASGGRQPPVIRNSRKRLELPGG